MLRSTELRQDWCFSCRSWLQPPAMLGFSALEWLPAEVPGHVHADLQRNGVIGDPFVALHELGSQWVDAEDWVYATRFAFLPNSELPRRVLRFEGLDTVCSILLNGVQVVTADNMFVAYEVDVTDMLKTGENTLEITFHSAVREGNRRRAAYLSQEALPDDLVRFDDRAFLRKADYMFGWDWGPRLVSAGIWKPVRLLEFSQRLTDVWIQQSHANDGAVGLTCSSTVEGGGQPVHFVSLAGRLPTRLLEGQTWQVTEPHLWWPAGMGEQPLYEVVTLLLPEGLEIGNRELSLEECEAIALDRRLNRIGLRTFELIQEPDEFGESFRFEINGQRLWCLGANWIPDHCFPSQVTADRLRAQLTRARDMNMNMLRVWGGGVYESDDFFDLCDELGLLVWQDFPFACSYAPDDGAAQAVMRLEARDNVVRLRNHPSLGLWCGNNENLMMFQNKWDDATKHPERLHGERIWDMILPNVVAELDPTRPYVPTSPHLGANANADERGDQHNWDVWHGRGDWVYYTESRARFPSEYGFAAAPSRAAWEAMLPSRLDFDALDVRHPVARWHDKTKKGYTTFLGYVELHYAASRNLAEWTYTSQLNQRDALRTAIEHYRRSEFAFGSLIWQLNDCWPVQSWSVVDSRGSLKAAGVELRRLHAPLLAAVEWVGSVGPGTHGTGAEPIMARIWAVYDNASAAATAQLQVELRDSKSGSVLQVWTPLVELLPSQRKCIIDIDLSEVSRTETVLWTEFAGFRSFRTLCEPKELQVAPPRWEVRRVARGVELRSDAPALDVCAESLTAEADLQTAFFSLPEAGTFVAVCRSYPKRIKVTSLAGSVVLAVPES